MIECPFCGEENIDGADHCQECQQALDFLSKPRPANAVERSLIKDRVSVLTHNRPLMVMPETAVGEVLQLMAEREVGCVIVAREECIAGIFSERDALDRLNVRFAELSHRPISEFMTPSPETVEPESRIAFALHKMDVGGYRHLPVTSGGKIVGVISVRDILRYITEKLLAEPAR
jgi:CBS domain-containing protein